MLRTICLIVLTGFSLSGCESVEQRAAREAEQARRENASILGGQRGKTFQELREIVTGKISQDGGIAVNKYLWRAALETISFLPIERADPYSGVIQSSWYSDPVSATRQERLRVDIFVLSSHLETKSLKTAVHKQILQPSGQWIDVTSDPRQELALANAILLRARTLRMSDTQ